VDQIVSRVAALQLTHQALGIAKIDAADLYSIVAAPVAPLKLSR
jgi:hypothetical protein